MTDDREDSCAIDDEEERLTEATPLLLSDGSPAQSKHRRGRGSQIAIIVLILLAVSALALGFIIPQGAKAYIESALELELTSVKVLHVERAGAAVQASGTMSLDPRRDYPSGLQRHLTNTLLRLAGPIVLKDSKVKLFLQRDGSHQIAQASLSDLTLRLANGAVNTFTLNSSVIIHNTDALGDLARDLTGAHVSQIDVMAVIDTQVVRFISMKKTIVREMSYAVPSDLHTLPNFNLSKLNVRDLEGNGIGGSAALGIDVQLPIDATIPPMTFDIAIEGCNGKHINMAQAANEEFSVVSTAASIQLNGIAQCASIPTSATKRCGTLKQTPLDRIVQSYLTGNETTVYISGSKTQLVGHPSWLQDLLARVTVPVIIPGNKNDQLARDIELLDVRFNLPSLIGGGSSKPKISGRIRGTIDIPREISVAVDVKSVHVLADLFYKNTKFAYIESPGWSPATSVFPKPGELQVQVVLKDAPVTITNQDVFSTIISELFGGNVLVDIKGNADVRITTGLGDLEAHQLPIEAKGIEIGGLGFLGNLAPKVKEIGVLRTTRETIEFVAEAEVE